MKEVFNDKKKLYLIVTAIFLITSLIIKIIPNNIGYILLYTIFPIYFFALTFLKYKYSKIDWNMPIILTLIYLFVGYIINTNIFNTLMVLIAYLSSIILLIILKIKYKKKLKCEKHQERSENDKRKISLLLPLLSIITLEFYYSICTFDVARIPITFLPATLGIILIYAFYMLFLAIFRRTDRALIGFTLLFLVIYIINEGRIYYTSDTVLISDLLFLQHVGEVAAFADVTFINCIHFIFFPTILTIIVLCYLVKVGINNNIKITNYKKMFINLGIAIAVILLLFIPITPLDKFFVTKAYNIYDGRDLAITASNTRYFYRYGVLPGLYGKYIEEQRFVPDNYNEEELTKMLNDSEKIEGTWKKPNIIVIFSESFWDISRLDTIKFDNEVTPNFNKLKENNSIQMISPAYGGMSSNVEFEVLTGGSLNYFSKGYTPYMQFFKKGVSENNPSIIQELKNNGYKTKILNSASHTMFNCDIIYDIYGIDERNHLYDEIDLGGQYVSDEYLTDRIIEYFDNKDKNEKVFFFTITMGGHMPYYEERYDNYHVNIVETPYEKDVNEVIHSYAEGIYLADRELGRLYDYINTLDEETIIVFFGDHLPHLSTPDGKDALFKTDYLQYDYNLNSVYKQYNTTALILSNYDIDFNGTEYLSPDLLLTFVINNMDIEVSPFYRWLYSTKDVLPSSNYVISQDNDGNIYYTLGLDGKMKEMYDLRKKVQYMLFK